MERMLWLADVARAAGLPVEPVPGWQTRGGMKDSDGQQLDPQFIIEHSTAEANNGSNAGGLGGVVHGTPSAPPPVANFYIGRRGTVFVVASGVSNNAGTGNARVAGAPAVHGNAKTIGIEHANNNLGEPWTPAMRASSVRLTAALLGKIRQPASHVLAHREWSTTGKTDPRGIDMAIYRSDVAKTMGKKDDPEAWPAVPMNVANMSAASASTAFSHDMRQVPWPALPKLGPGAGGPDSPALGTSHQQEQIRAVVRWFHDVARTLFKTQMIPDAEFKAREVGQGTLAFARLIHLRTGTPWRGSIDSATWQILGHQKSSFK